MLFSKSNKLLQYTYLVIYTYYIYIYNIGRAWKAQELRQKSFDDLHKLWYVLLKERNVLATQREEASRLKLPKQIWTNQGRLKKVCEYDDVIVTNVQFIKSVIF